MAKKYNKQKVKLGRNAIIILVVTLLVVVGVITLTNLPRKDKAITDTYSSLTTGNHVFEKISYKSFKSKVEKGEEFFLFYGKKDCAACQERVSDLNSLAQNLGVKTIYYLDANSLSDDQKSELYSTYRVKKNFTPQIISFKAGAKVLDSFTDMFDKTYNEETDTKENFKIACAHVLNSI